MVLVGFDGFIDTLVHPIKQTGQPFASLKDFGKKICLSSEKSCNIELAISSIQLGGNGPLLARALALHGHNVLLAGLVDHPIFSCLDNILTRICLGAPGQTDALEFDDGKLLLGKLASLHACTLERIFSLVPQEQWLKYVRAAPLIACVNWTMLSMMTPFWHWLAQTLPIPSKKTWLFVDLADPSKRSDQELQEALEALYRLTPIFDVVLGLNEAEAERVSSVLQCTMDASSIRQKSQLTRIAIHTKRYSSFATHESAWKIATEIIQKPFISTGAGDHFNAGLCHGLLSGWHPEKTLFYATQLATHYVATGQILCDTIR